MFIRLEGQIDSRYLGQILHILPLMLVIKIATYAIFGLYNRMWRYASIYEMLVVVGAVTTGSILTYGYIKLVEPSFPRSIIFLSWLLNIVLIGGSRVWVRVVYYVLRNYKKPIEPAQVLIVGAGDAGAVIAKELQQRYHEHKKIVGFIDDDPGKSSQLLLGIKVLGKTKDVARIVQEKDVKEIIIAMPSVDGQIVRQIVNKCKATKCRVQTLPGIYELIDGQVSVRQLRKVEVEDLLRRDPVSLDVQEIASYLKNNCILVTGAGGSIGSELCRQIAKMVPKTLILLGKGENSIYEIERELRENYPELDLKAIIADVRDKERINKVFEQLRPQVVFHAAAHKHVPLMEAQPVEAVRNNVFGTRNVAQAADKFQTEIFVMVSTDKAVNPTSVMGATKRLAELTIQGINGNSKTKFVAVRFGNVLGSRGSVIPLFKSQIAKGGPLTITHPEMKRYFMTIPEASQLVLQAGSMACGGEVFVLDMGQPIKIVDMAKDLIELSGLEVDKDIKIVYSGLRPGEKLFEELLTAEEGTNSTKHRKIFKANLKQVDIAKLEKGLDLLAACDEAEKIIKIMSYLIPTYKSAKMIERIEKEVGVSEKNSLEKQVPEQMLTVNF